jgi:membrane protease YdiL (CAAX protease family)
VAGVGAPRLLARHNALVASLILGVLWALWHLPLLWLDGVHQIPRTRLADPRG